MESQGSGPRRVAIPAAGPGRSEDSMLAQVVGGRYRLVTPLGAGQVGAVYRAEDLGDRGTVAVKVLHRDVTATEALRERFDRAAAELLVLDHPSVAALIDHGISTVDPFLVSRYFEGQSLARRLASGPLSAEEILQVAPAILGALGYLHQRRLWHLDLKASNVILLEGPPFAVLLDAGLGRLVLREERGAGPLLTVNGAVFGDPALMAPEQASGEVADGRADLYALGALLFEMIAGARLFDGDSSDQMLKHMYSPAPTLRERSPRLRPGPELDAFFDRALSKAPSERFQSAKEMLAVLERFAEPLRKTLKNRRRPAAGGARPSATSTPAAASRSQWPLLTAIAGLSAFCVVGAAAVGVLWSRRASSPETVVTSAVAATEPAEPGSPSAPSLELQPRPSAPVDNAHLAEPTPEPDADLLTDAALMAEAGPLVEPTMVFDASPEAGQGSDGAPSPVVSGGGLWADLSALPPAVVEAKAQLDRGATLGDDTVKALRAEAMGHPDDPRPLLLLARYRVSRSHFTDALDRYEAAVKADPRARQEPRMLQDLVEMVKTRALGLKATMAIRRIYGREAIDAIDAALATPGLDADDATRLRTCRRFLLNMPQE